MGRGKPWGLRSAPRGQTLPWETLTKSPSSSVHPSPEGLELGHPSLPALHALCSYPLFASGELQDVAHDFFIHASEQLLLGGT